MKKLVVVLFFALTGGLFAQQWNFSGLVNGGLGILMLEDEDDSAFGLIARNQQGNGIRAQLDAIGTNKDGNAGIVMRLRAVGGGSNTFRDDFQFRRAYGWVSFMDNLLRVQGGRMQGNDFDTLDPITDGDTLFDNYGVLTYINPTDSVKISVGAFTPQRLGEGLNIDAVAGYAGFSVNLPDLLNLRAQLSSQKDDVKALASARISAVKGIPIELTARLTDLSNFSDTGTISFFEHVGYNAIDNLSFNLAAAQSISQAEDTDIYFRAWLWLTYAMGDIIPRLDFNYVTGGKFRHDMGLGVNSPFKDGYEANPFTYDKNNAFFTVSPSIQFRAAANTFVDLGYIFAKDMGDAPAFGTKDKGTNHAACIDVRVSF
ncbi:MAG: hypothetical protein LBH42_06090 [Treponema sp.]|jgi:hypothetical protein|nr:hypothetical protein [Treponema sp.]